MQTIVMKRIAKPNGNTIVTINFRRNLSVKTKNTAVSCSICEVSVRIELCIH